MGQPLDRHPSPRRDYPSNTLAAQRTGRPMPPDPRAGPPIRRPPPPTYDRELPRDYGRDRPPPGPPARYLDPHAQRYPSGPGAPPQRHRDVPQRRDLDRGARRDDPNRGLGRDPRAPPTTQRGGYRPDPRRR